MPINYLKPYGQETAFTPALHNPIGRVGPLAQLNQALSNIPAPSAPPVNIDHNWLGLRQYEPTPTQSGALPEVQNPDGTISGGSWLNQASQVASPYDQYGNPQAPQSYAPQGSSYVPFNNNAAQGLASAYAQAPAAAQPSAYAQAPAAAQPSAYAQAPAQSPLMQFTVQTPQGITAGTPGNPWGGAMYKTQAAFDQANSADAIRQMNAQYANTIAINSARSPDVPISWAPNEQGLLAPPTSGDATYQAAHTALAPGVLTQAQAYQKQLDYEKGLTGLQAGSTSMTTGQADMVAQNNAQGQYNVNGVWYHAGSQEAASRIASQAAAYKEPLATELSPYSFASTVGDDPALVARYPPFENETISQYAGRLRDRKGLGEGSVSSAASAWSDPKVAEWARMATLQKDPVAYQAYNDQLYATNKATPVILPGVAQAIKRGMGTIAYDAMGNVTGVYMNGAYGGSFVPSDQLGYVPPEQGPAEWYARGGLVQYKLNGCNK